MVFERFIQETTAAYPSLISPDATSPVEMTTSSIWCRIKAMHLIGGWPTPLKNISQWEGLSHILWKIIQMFETTNQAHHVFPSCSLWFCRSYKSCKVFPYVLDKTPKPLIQIIRSHFETRGFWDDGAAGPWKEATSQQFRPVEPESTDGRPKMVEKYWNHGVKPHLSRVLGGSRYMWMQHVNLGDNMYTLW